MPPNVQPMTPLTLTAYTLVTANGRGLDAVSRPCASDDRA